MGDSKETVNPYTVRSLERGLRILRCFEPDHPSRTLIELCDCTGLHKSTCFRLVKTLEAEGYLTVDAQSGEYRLGAALVRVALLAMSHDGLARVAHPHLTSLTEITGETADLTAWSPDGPLLIDQSLTRHGFHPRNTVGQVFVDPLSSHARIWLAFGTAGQRRRALALYTGPGGIPAGEIEAFERGVEAAARDRYAVDISEERGVCAVGVPVWGASADLLACVSVVAPYRRSPAETIKEWRRSLQAAAAALSEELGYRG